MGNRSSQRQSFISSSKTANFVWGCIHWIKKIREDDNKPGEWLVPQEGRGLRRDTLRDSPGYRQHCTVGSHRLITEFRSLHMYFADSHTVAILCLSKVRVVSLAFTKDLRRYLLSPTQRNWQRAFTFLKRGKKSSQHLLCSGL